MKKEKLFTIGQFAALHRINKKTLMWYDEVGLFKPAKIEDNGYRYYTYYQSARLETILMMRELHMSISEIRDFLGNRSLDTYLDLLHKKSDELSQKIKRMKRIKHSLSKQESALSDLSEKDLSRIDIVDKNEEYLYLVASDKELSLDKEIEQMIESIKEHDFNTLHDTTYGSMISIQSLLNSEFDQYDSLFMKAPRHVRKKEIHIKPKGKYIQAYCIGAWDRLPARYKEILGYCRDSHLQPFGYSYEMGINEMLINSIDDYITQIEIPIKLSDSLSQV